MLTFLIGIAILVAGGFLYGNFVEKIFVPDDRKTPAVTFNDNVDFVPMNKWKNAMINLLNIAGTGPIFGPIQGILFGPIAFITIPLGCVISGATHDYMCGMLSLRQNGAQMPLLIRKFLGRKIYYVYNAFLCLLLILITTVFIYTPGDIFAKQILGLKNTCALTWIIYGLILLYYLCATIFPIDKIIGKVYPIFGAVLLASAVGVFFGIFINGYQLNNISFENGFKGIFNLYPMWNAAGNSGSGTKFIPVFFVTVACGITSGFHSTQCTLIGRSVSSEREGKMTFYWPMILEGFIALTWAAAAMGVYNAGSTSDATNVVGEVAKGTLGAIGGLIAIIGVVVLPITSGDTALRSCRLIVSEFFNIDQKNSKKRMLLSFFILIPVVLILIYAKTDSKGFNVIWKYFAWANQTIAVFAFALCSIYLMAKKGVKKFAFLITLIPGTFYMYIVSLFILNQRMGFNIPYIISSIIAAFMSVIYVYLVVFTGNKHLQNSLEE